MLSVFLLLDTLVAFVVVPAAVADITFVIVTLLAVIVVRCIFVSTVLGHFSHCVCVCVAVAGVDGGVMY